MRARCSVAEYNFGCRARCLSRPPAGGAERGQGDTFRRGGTRYGVSERWDTEGGMRSVTIEQRVGASRAIWKMTAVRRGRRHDAVAALACSRHCGGSPVRLPASLRRRSRHQFTQCRTKEHSSSPTTLPPMMRSGRRRRAYKLILRLSRPEFEPVLWPSPNGLSARTSFSSSLINAKGCPNRPS